jgi:hypothetical protein
MTFTDWVGSIGVFILLSAYFLNLFNKIEIGGFVYLYLNLIGAMIACFASILLGYKPFIILEASWALVSIFGIYNTYKNEGIKISGKTIQENESNS